MPADTASSPAPPPLDLRPPPARYRAVWDALWRLHLHLWEHGPDDEHEALRQEASRRLREHGLGDDSDALLDAQVEASRRLRPPLRFADHEERNRVLALWTNPLADLFGRLAGARGSWQQRPLHQLAIGFFLTRALLELPRDLAEDRLLLPEEALASAGVEVEDLREGRMREAVRRLLWKEVVRARDHLAQGQPLLAELDRAPRKLAVRAWLGALALLDEVERRDYDVFTEPIVLKPHQRFGLRLQALLGKAAKRRR